MAKGCHTRRFRQLCGHVIPARATAAPAVSAARANDDGRAERLVASTAASAGRRLLGAVQVERFVRDGYLILQLDDLSPEVGTVDTWDFFKPGCGCGCGGCWGCANNAPPTA